MKMDFVHWTSGSKCQTTLKEEKQSRWAIWVPWLSDRREFLSYSEGSGKLAGARQSFQFEDTEVGDSIYQYNWYSQYTVLEKKRQKRNWEYWKSSEGPLMMISRYTPWNFPTLWKKSTLIEYISRYYRYYTAISWLTTLFPKQKTLQVIGH